jgi:hypothetical protein
VRDHLARTIYTDAQLTADGVTRAGTFSGDVDSPSMRPYLVLRWGETSPGVGRSLVRRRTLLIYVHDKPNDYTRIDRIIRRIREVFESMAGERTDTGWITQIDWETDSGDLSDDTSRTIMRTSAFNIVGQGM